MSSQSAVSLVNNRDLSSVSAKSLATSMAMAGIGAGITGATGFGKVTPPTPGQTQVFALTAKSIVQKSLLDAGLRSAITGQNFGKSLEQAGVSAAVYTAQFGVGEVGVAKELADGSLTKTLMHAGIGGIAGSVTGGENGFAAGALGGAMAEQSSRFIDPHSAAQKQAVGVVSATAAMLASGGSVKAMTSAQTVSVGAIEYNSQLHAARAVAIPLELAAAAVVASAVAYNASLSGNVEDGYSVVAPSGNGFLDGVTAVGSAMQNMEIEHSSLMMGGSSTSLMMPANKGSSSNVTLPVPDLGPRIFTTPIHEPKSSVFVTPIPAPSDVFVLPGFSPAPAMPKDRGFEIPTLPNMHVLYNDKGGLDEATTQKPHGNDKSYVGDTHVYVIRDSDGNLHKVGESMQGLNKLDLSKRAEEQVRKLRKATDKDYDSEIRRTFPTKAEAREYETKLIERFRSMFGKEQLPGNKGNR